MRSDGETAPGAPHVIATAGHVDHGKSSLIVRLTGIDPDRWEEEKRRGLTIDLGFAWTTLPSGREVGFVDVPGHERFLRNMLAGVGPVRLVLFVVAADEGWKPQSEEHLEIVDVLGVSGGVVALTKADLVDHAVVERRSAEVRGKMEDTALAGVPIIACSSTSGQGLDELRSALDEMLAGAARSQGDTGRARLSVDRSFTIAGAGTVVTGTLTGGPLRVGDEIEMHPSGARARVRSLQTHQRSVEIAHPVSRVAANLAGTTRDAVERGDVIGRPGEWRTTSVLDVRLLPVRTLSHQLTHRGAYKVYLGTAERDARLRFHDGPLEPGGSALARVRLSRPVAAATFDRFVLREAGRRETVAGGIVLDPHPAGRRSTPGALLRREGAEPAQLPRIVIEERGAVPAREMVALAGSAPPEIQGAVRIGTWWVSERAAHDFRSRVEEMLATHHDANPMLPGMEIAVLRSALEEELEGRPALTATLLDELARKGALVREGTILRLPGHTVTLGEREPEVELLLEVVRQGEPTPPDVRDLASRGFDRRLVDAACDSGRLVRISPEIVVTHELAAAAEEAARRLGASEGGISVSAFRQELATTRKYALPLLAWLDARGITIRAGDSRRLAG